MTSDTHLPNVITINTAVLAEVLTVHATLNMSTMMMMIINQHQCYTRANATNILK